MRMITMINRAILALAVGSSWHAVAVAGTPIRERAVDSLLIKQGPKLYGAVLSRAKDGTVTMAVQRGWLKANAPKLYAEESKRERQRLATAPRKRLERIRAWMKERAASKQLLPFLKSELKRLEADAKKKAFNRKPVQTQFLLVMIPTDKIRGGYRQPASRRRVALLAWKSRLKDVESRPLKLLVKELRSSSKIDLSKPVDLSDRLPRGMLESAQQWAARMAVVENDYLKRVRFQGTDDILVQAGGDIEKKPDLTKLFAGLYKSQLDQLIEEALGNGVSKRGSRQKKWKESLAKAAKTADAEKVRGFRVSRLQPDLANQRVTVEERFLAKMPDGNWVTIWTNRETVDASKSRKDLEQRIKDDERVKQALKLVKGLGLGANKDQLAKAIRFGAATKVAQEKANDKFLEFRNRYARKLDIAPLKW